MVLSQKSLNGSHKTLQFSILIIVTICVQENVKILCSKTSKKIECIIENGQIYKGKQLNVYVKEIFSLIIKYQFSYCPLVWMLCFRRSNNLRSNVYERVLRVIYNGQYGPFTEFLSIKDDSTIHQQNIQTLMKEVYKFMSNFSFLIASNSFRICDNIYNLRNF